MMRRLLTAVLPVPALLDLGCSAIATPVSPPVVVTVVVTATPEEPTPVVHRATDEAVTLGSGVVLTDTVALTLTVRAAEPTVYLFDTPVLRDADGGEVTPLPQSLEEAHFALLDCITQRQATIGLEFPRPGGEPPWTLVFNPQHEPGDYLAPRVEVRVENER